MFSTVKAIKWMFTTSMYRRVLSFLLFFFLIKLFTREEIGVYREFTVIISFATIISVFSFNYLIIVEKAKNIFVIALQFLLISAFILCLLIFIFKNFLAKQYSPNSPESLYFYLKYAFGIIYIEGFYKLIRSIHELELNFIYLSKAETINNLFFVASTLTFFIFDLKIYYFVFSYYLGTLIEIIILTIPKFSYVKNCFMETIRFKHLYKIKFIFNKYFSFLFYCSIPTILNFLIAEAPIIILGMFFAPKYMGNYFIASQFILVPFGLISYSIHSVLFPVFSITEKKLLKDKIYSFISNFSIVFWIPMLVFGKLVIMFAFLIVGNVDNDLVKSLVALITVRVLLGYLIDPLTSIPIVLKKPQYELIWTVITRGVHCILLFLFRNLDFIVLISMHTAISILSQMSFILVVCKIVDLNISKTLLRLLKSICYALPLIIFLFIDINNLYKQILFLFILIVISYAFLILKEKDVLRNLYLLIKK